MTKIFGKNVTRRELAATTGIGLVGFMEASTGAVAVTEAAKWCESVSVFDCMLASEIADAQSNAATYDLTEKIDQLSLDVKAAGGGVIRFPPGTFSLSKITRRNGVSLVGSGCTSTYIKARLSASTGMVEIESGPVIGSHLKGLHFIGGLENNRPTNAGQWGMYIHAKWDAGYVHGGLWMSEHDDLRFTHFDNGIWSRGGYTNANYLRPNQFLKFDNVFVQVNTNGTALRMTGQHGQISFSGGSADARDGLKARCCVELDYDPDPRTTADNASGHGESTADIAGVGNSVLAPLNVEFGGGFSMQKSQEGAFIRHARAINFKDCWVENVGKAFTASTGSQISVHASHLANAADGRLFFSAGNGYLVSTGLNASVDFGAENNITGTVDNITDPSVSLNNPLGVSLYAVNTATTNKFKAAAYKSTSLTTTSINLSGHRFATVSHGTNKKIFLKTVISSAAPGTVVYLRAILGPLTLGDGGNISLNGLLELTMPQDGVIALLRIPEVGGSGEWVMLSTPLHYDTAVPANGYYYAVGTQIWKSNPTATSSQGWTCVTAGLAGTTAVFKAMPPLLADKDAVGKV